MDNKELFGNSEQLELDTISRQAAIDALDEIEAEVADGYGYQYAKWREYFVEMPPAQPKRIRGKWIHDGGKWKNRWICSNCGYKWFFDCIEGAYCPNCGAKMEVTE